jgi:hypothetical protein
MTLTSIIDSAKLEGVDPNDYIDKIWNCEVPLLSKIKLSLELYNNQLSYHVLATMWLEYKVQNGKFETKLNEVIYTAYQEILSNSNVDHENGMCYSLLFDIFQEPDIQMEAWEFFMKANSSEKFKVVLLRNCLPVPYSIKEKFYGELIPDKSFHKAIIESIFSSYIYTIYYKVEFDKRKALDIIHKLEVKKYITEFKNEYTPETFLELESFFHLPNGS